LTGLACGLVLTGCAKPPEAELQQAKGALEAATTPDVESYAPESLAAARNAMTEVDIELKAQEERMALTRDYEKTKELTAKAEQAAKKAVSDAVAEKQRVREETEALILAVRQSVEEVKAMLDSMPTGKGTAADIAAIRADVASAEQELASLDASLQEGNYLEAKAKAESLQQITQDTRTEIERAIELSKQKPRRS
jgi:hypothetical protein